MAETSVAEMADHPRISFHCLPVSYSFLLHFHRVKGFLATCKMYANKLLGAFYETSAYKIPRKQDYIYANNK